MKMIKILAVDDHEMTTLGYKFILEDTQFEDYSVQVDTAKSFQEAQGKINNSLQSFPYDILLLDIQLGPSTEGTIKTGEDLGIWARKTSPDSLIVFMSSFSA